MDILHGSSLKATEYVNKLLNSSMNILLKGTGFTWKGLFNSNTTYTTNDVVLYYTPDTEPQFYIAKKNSKATFSTNNWNLYNFVFADKDEVETTTNKIDGLLRTLIFALTGSTSFRGAYSVTESYEANDIAIVVIGENIVLVRAKSATNGQFDTSKWEVLKLMTSTEVQGYSNAGADANITRVYDISIPANNKSSDDDKGWMGSVLYPGYPFWFRLNIEFMKKDYVVAILWDKDCYDELVYSNLCPIVKVENGYLAFYASRLPLQELRGKMVIINTVNGANTTVTPYKTISLNKDNWVTDDIRGSGVKYELTTPMSAENHVILVFYDFDILAELEIMNMSHIIDVTDGKLIFHASTAPNTNITGIAAYANIMGTELEQILKPIRRLRFETEGWYQTQANKEDTAWNRRYDMYLDFVSSRHYGVIIYDYDSLSTIENMYLDLTATLKDGVISFYSQSVPENEFEATLVLFNTAEGTILSQSLESLFDVSQIATDAEAQAAINAALGH